MFMKKVFTSMLLLMAVLSMRATVTSEVTWSLTGSQTDKASVYWLGVTTPNDGSLSFTMSQFKIYLVSRAAGAYMVISTTATSSSSVPKSTVVGVSTNKSSYLYSNQYVTYNFSNVALTPNTTYYIYFVSNISTTNTYYTRVAQRIGLSSGTYSPAMRFTNGTQTTSWQPIYTATLTSYKADPVVEPDTTTTGGGGTTGTDTTATTTTSKIAKFFCTSYGAKWIHIQRANDPTYFASYYQQVSGSDAYYCQANTADTTDAAHTWCFVGTEDDFLIYNRQTGANYALGTNTTSYANGTYATLYPTSSSYVRHWHVADYTSASTPGYDILPLGNTSFAVNMYGGTGDSNRYLRLYTTANQDNGNQWWFYEATVDTTTTTGGGTTGGGTTGTDTTTTTTTSKIAKYFATTYGAKWVRIQRAKDTNYFASYYQQVSGSDAYYCQANTADTTDAAHTWCFVGTEDDFLIYNRQTGANYALGTSTTSYANGTYTTLYPTSSAYVRHWHVVDYTSASTPGYAILPLGNTSFAVNMYGGVDDANRYLRLYTTANQDNGNQWWFYEATVDTTTTTGGGTSGGGTTGGTGSTTNSDNMDGVSQTLYQNVSSDYPWRIPSIAHAYNGDLIALGGYLGCGTDIGWGRCDVYGRTSSDNGKTWGSKYAIAEGTGTFGVRTSGTSTNYTCGYGDAAIVADAASNKVLIMSCTGGYSYSNSTRNSSLSTVIRTARYYGNYDTTSSSWTWTTPTDVTSQIYGLVPNVNKLFVASGKICQSRQIKVGDYYRVYIALCTNLGNYVLYSDDFGTTWKNLGSSTTSCASGGDEPKCEELPNGNVVLSSRTSSGRIFNIFTYTNQSTAAGSWASAVYSYNYSGGISYGSNACNGEILMVDAIRNSDNAQVTLALQSAPTGSSRSNVKIFYKELTSTSDYDTPADFATGWDGSYQVSSTTSAYSTMCKQGDRIGFFYEENYTTAVAYGDGYDLVYKRFPLETITSNAYSMKTATTAAKAFDGQATAINSISTDTENGNIYTIDGRLVRKSADAAGARQGLAKGVYIINHKKIVVK
jgi:hypothetical protein